MTFLTRFNPPPINRGEVNEYKSEVDDTGYIDTNKLIRSMLDSGEILQNIRSREYDEENPEVDDSAIAIPLNRIREFDLVELGRIRDAYLLAIEQAKQSKSMDDAAANEDITGAGEVATTPSEAAPPVTSEPA